MRRFGLLPLVVSFAVAAVAFLVPGQARAQDPGSLRLTRQGGSIQISWTDATPTAYCVLRNPTAPPSTILVQVSALGYLDAAPAAPVLYYDVEEQGLATCPVVPPPTVACCMADGTCQDITVAACTTAGGTPGAAGSACATTVCPAPQACCMPDGSCRTLTAAGCAAAGGNPQGAGTSCATSNCSLNQACCLGNGSCQDITSAACAAAGGTAQGAGTTCATATCTPAQACCLGNGGCQDLTPAACAAAGGVAKGAGTACATTTCPAADACCMPTGACQDLLATSCVTAGGADQGAGSTCATTSCSPPPSVCVTDGWITCGGALAQDNGWPVSTNTINSYPCAPWDESGPEHAFRFAAAQSGSATATISGMTQDLDVFVLQESGGSCNPSGCVAADDAAATFTMTAGAIYDIVVDGRSGADSNFLLNLTCNVPPSPCTVMGTGSCGDYLGGNNGAAGSVNNASSYSCAPGVDESGPEETWRVVAADNESLHVVMDLNTSDLDLFVSEEQGDGCPGPCLAWGDQDVTFHALPGHVYDITVDGRAGAVSDYRLWLDCQHWPGACNASTVVHCGDHVVGNNGQAGSTSTIDTWNCLPYPEAGPEYGYTFVAPSNGTLTATVASTNSDVTVFLLADTGNGCQEADCQAGGAVSASIPVTAGSTYYIVADGYLGAVDDYTIDLSCQ